MRGVMIHDVRQVCDYVEYMLEFVVGDGLWDINELWRCFVYLKCHDHEYYT